MLNFNKKWTGSSIFIWVFPKSFRVSANRFSSLLDENINWFLLLAIIFPIAEKCYDCKTKSRQKFTRLCVLLRLRENRPPENWPPDTCPLKNCPLENCPPENCHLWKLHPLKIPTYESSPLWKFSPLKIAPLKFAPKKITPRKLTPRKLPPMKVATIVVRNWKLLPCSGGHGFRGSTDTYLS